VLAEHADRIGEQLIEGAPDLVIEILSPGSAGRDINLKRELYASSGVPEYWIVDPKRQAIEILVLKGVDYASLGIFDRHATVRSEVITGLSIELNEIF
jgi:Uma2 family endonuclease